MRMSESALEHNMRLESEAQRDDHADRKRGMWMGFAGFAVLIVGALVATFLGQATIVGLFLGAAALGIVGQFIGGRKK